MVKHGSNAVDRHVGQRVRLQRNSLGLTQTQLGEAVGVSFQQIALYEKGINRIGAGRLEQIAKTLGVTTSYFYETEADLLEQTEQSTAILLETAAGYELIKGFLRIKDPRLRRVVIGFGEELADAEFRLSTSKKAPPARASGASRVGKGTDAEGCSGPRSAQGGLKPSGGRG